ncbi:MAG: hypothetical protein JSS09_07810 [Verrucomicrobia bacterium]|nr:hypothetical protein [Verrucomicrobiota bacterium]
MGLVWPVSSLYTPRKLAQSGYTCLPVSLFLSLERVMALLIESKRGKIPFCLAPCQVKILPVQKENEEYAKQIALELKKRSVRAEVDKRSLELKPRLRFAFAEEVPFVIAISDKEQVSEKVSLRGVGVEPKSLSLEELIGMFNQ